MGERFTFNLVQFRLYGFDRIAESFSFLWGELKPLGID